MGVKQVARNTTPLCFLPDGRLLCYHRGKVLILHEGKVEKILACFASTPDRFLGWSRLVSRLLRLGVRAAIAIDNEIVVMSIGNRLYELNLKTGDLSKGYTCESGVRPLTFTSIYSLVGFEDGVYFGGYIRNPDMNSVRIYHRIGVDEWKVIYSFPDGVINHVHNIIPDPFRQCVWIMTGDFDDAAAIWQAKNGFSKVKRIGGGDQLWRGCIAFVISEGLLYATDTPFAKNHILLMKEDGSTDSLGEISGSCIYGCRWGNRFVFSTTVEGDGRDETVYKLLFSRKTGSGIIDKYVRMYMGCLSEGFNVVYKERKDVWPFLFQFGAFKFPAGENRGDTLYFQPIATKSNDLRLMALNINVLDKCNQPTIKEKIT